MDATDAFLAHFAPDADEPHLDVAALLIAKHAHPELDVDRQRAKLQQLAEGVVEPGLDGVTRFLFGELGFVGNTASYYDPANSFLDQVLERRWGIPITLTILTHEVGRRRGVASTCIGMPGHFLLRDDSDGQSGDIYVDPFGGGRRLDSNDCAALFRSVRGDDAEFHNGLLAESPPAATALRLLNNLRMIYTQRNEPRQLVWVMRLICGLPGAGPDARVALAGVLTNLGAYREAAEQCELAAVAAPDEADALLRRAMRLRARLN